MLLHANAQARIVGSAAPFAAAAVCDRGAADPRDEPTDRRAHPARRHPTRLRGDAPPARRASALTKVQATSSINSSSQASGARRQLNTNAKAPTAQRSCKPSDGLEP